MSTSRRTMVLIGIGGAIMAGLAVVSFRPAPVAVDLHVVERSAMTVTVDADGTTRVTDLYEIAAPITGTAQRSVLDVGDPVIMGETVVASVEPAAPALLDTRTRTQAEAAVHEAEAALLVAETELLRTDEDLAYAQSQYDRVQTLMERGVASPTQLEASQQQLSIATAARASAAARLEMSRGTLERAEAALIGPDTAPSANGAIDITAPASGVVLSIDAISARPVVAGTILLTVGDPQSLEIVADILSTEAVRLTEGAPARVERWGGQTTLDARLLRIEPAARTQVSALGIEEQRVNAIFEITTPPSARPGLGHGFSVFLRIEEWSNDAALQAPLGALVRKGAGWVVFAERDGIAAEVAVEVGRMNGRTAEILTGLDEGARIVTHPSDDIAEGTRLVERQ